MSLPLVDLRGDPREQGRGHGEALRDQIHSNLDLYFDRFANEAQLQKTELLARTQTCLDALRRQSPDYELGMEGIAEGSGADPLAIAMLNLRYELLYDAVAHLKMEAGDGCTSWALLPEATREGRLLLGQNWDWIPGVEGALLRIEDKDGLLRLGFTEAGIFAAKIGLNSAGLALAINGMTTTEDDWRRLQRPFHLRCQDLLSARSLKEALSALTDTERSCTANFMIGAAPDEAIDVELAPSRERRLSPERGQLVHANHFVDPAAAGVTEPPDPRRRFSEGRHARMDALLRQRQPLDVDGMQEVLRDHDNLPNALCRHPDTDLPPAQRIVTICAVIMDPLEGRLWITDGQPCSNQFAEYRL